jgi:hypothetical protein
MKYKNQFEMNERLDLNIITKSMKWLEENLGNMLQRYWNGQGLFSTRPPRSAKQKSRHRQIGLHQTKETSSQQLRQSTE